MCQENIAKFEDGTWRLGNVVTVDEVWFDWPQLVKKQSNKSWFSEGEKDRSLIRIGRFDPKNLFAILFRISNVEQISYLDKYH